MGALVVVTAVLYFWRLDDTPGLTRDEAFIGLSAHAIANTGRDIEGRSHPLYFHFPIDGSWWSPILPYAVAATLKILPFSEAALRTPLALAAVLNVVLVFLIGRMLFADARLAIAAAAMLALSPVQLIENRYGNDPGVTATVALVWMLAVLVYLRSGRAGALAAAGLVLGIGMFGYVGAVPLMPLYLLVTLAVPWIRHDDRWLPRLAPALVFLLPIALSVPWFIQHPDTISTGFLHYQQADPSISDTATGLRVMASVQRLAGMATLYVEFWDPRFLFVRGSDVLRHSTGHVGVYLVTLAGLLGIGVVQAARRAISDTRCLVLLAAFLLAPVPSCLVAVQDPMAAHAIWRAGEILSCGALLAGLGLECLLTERDARRRAILLSIAIVVPLAIVAIGGAPFPYRWAIAAVLALGAVAAMAAPARLALPGALAALAVVALLQYTTFYVDYMTDFREKSILQTDGNMRGLLETVIALSPPADTSKAPAGWIYLGFRLGPADWGNYYWRFYIHKHHREDLLIRTLNDQNASEFNHDRICVMPTGSLLTTRIGWDPATDALIDRMIAKGELTHEGAVGWPIYWLMRKTDKCATLGGI